MSTRPVLALALAFALPVGCGGDPGRPVSAPDPGPRLEALLAAAVGDGSVVRGAALAVDAPTLGLAWQGASGLADPASGRAMTPATPVRVASNTKTFVAAAVLRLVEGGRLGLDDPVAGLLPAEAVGLLRGDGYDPDRVLVRHLLTHTSGLFDHTSSPRYEERILADPGHRWTPLEQLRCAMEWGQPLAAPGEAFAYCDTGYVLLGLVLEEVTGRPLAAAVRDLVGFQRLGLASTWWESLEPAPTGLPPRAHQYLGDLDATDFDPSLDLYGGGGLVSTVGDLARFTRALVTGGVFARGDTLATMLAPPGVLAAPPGAKPGGIPPGAYRMGIWSEEVAGLPGFRHSGFWGTVACHVPELDLVVAVTVNQNRAKAAMEGLVAGAVEVARERARPR